MSNFQTLRPDFRISRRQQGEFRSSWMEWLAWITVTDKRHILTCLEWLLHSRLSACYIIKFVWITWNEEPQTYYASCLVAYIIVTSITSIFWSLIKHIPETVALQFLTTVEFWNFWAQYQNMRDFSRYLRQSLTRMKYSQTERYPDISLN